MLDNIQLSNQPKAEIKDECARNYSKQTRPFKIIAIGYKRTINLTIL